MRTIGHEELKQKLDRQDPFRLVMALGEWAYQAKHIPGSLHFATMREALHSLNKEDEIVVYCSDVSCIASAALGQLLERHGYTHVLHSKSPRDAKMTLMIVLYYYRKQRSRHVNKLNRYWMVHLTRWATEECRKYRKRSEPTLNFWGMKASSSGEV